MNYQILPDRELLEILGQAGASPPRELIQECMKRYESLKPDLLVLLIEANDPDWDEDDPRWYWSVHAGRLLLAHREQEAIPLFIEILVDDEADMLAEWFESDLHHYGPPLVPHLLDALNSDTTSGYAKTSIIEILTFIATRFPEARQPVLKALRAQLPPLREDGSANVDLEDLTQEDIDLLTFVANGLGELGDKRCLPHIEALHKQGLINETIYGSFKDYQKEFFSPKDFHRQVSKRTFDIYSAYGHTD
jgi:hypothetical protein